MSDLVRSPRTGPSVVHASPRWDASSVIDNDPGELRSLVRIVVRRKWLIAGVALAVVAPAVIGTLLAVPLYRSSAMIQIDPEPVQVLPYRDFDLPSPQYDTLMKTQEHVLAGQSLQARVAERLATAEGDRLRAELPSLGSRFSVERLENTQIFRLSYLAPSAAAAATIANMFAEEYIKLQFQTRQETRERARHLLGKELATLEARVQQSEQQLVDYARDHRLQPVEGDRGDLAQEKLSLLAKQVIEAETEMVTARARLDTLEKASVDNFPERLVSQVIGSRQATLLQLEHDLTALRASFGENWPAVQQKKSEIALVRDQLSREKSDALAQAKDQAMLDYRAAEASRRMFVAAKSDQERLVNQLQDASIQYNIIRREVETNQKLYDGLLERLRQTGVSPGMEFGSIRVIEPARPDETVASPNLKWNLLLASLFGLALGLCVALLRDYWDSSLSTVEEVEHVTVLPVLASVPLVRPASSAKGLLSTSVVAGLLPGLARRRARAEADTTDADRRIDLSRGTESAEAVRTLCASILLSRSDHPPRVLVVTSALPEEGKTTVAIQLGRGLAESGARTLLVECDMRRPAFGAEFGVGTEGGLSLYLSGHLPRAKIHTTQHDRLFVVGAGPIAPNPVALLNSQKMTAFLEEMTSSFQFVIMDTPPVLPMADARVLGPKADGVVLVVRAGQTPKRLLKRVCATLELSGANILGAVLNAADTRELESAYGYYYQQHRAS